MYRQAHIGNGRRAAALLVVLAFALSMMPAVTADGGAPATGSRDYVTHAPIKITGDAGFTAANGVSEGSGSEADPYVITGLEIAATDQHGISISDTTKYFSIEHCRFTAAGTGKSGIQVQNAVHVNIEYSEFESNDIGVRLKSVIGADLDYNTFTGNQKGVLVEESQNVNVDYSSIKGGTVGISIESTSIDNSQNIQVDYNTIVGSTTGISIKKSQASGLDYNTISGAGTGIFVEDCSEVSFDYNTIMSGTTGVSIKNTQTSGGDYNLFKDNTGYAITSTTSVSNTYNYNNFIGNGGTGKQAKAVSVTGDDWDGNHWSDWTTPDANGDKIVDDPYELDGGEAADTLPVAEEFPDAGVEIAPLKVTTKALPKSGDAPLNVAFSVVIEGGVQPYTVAWDLGDGSTSDLAVLSHIYTNPGSYDAKVTVTDFLTQTFESTPVTITVTGTATLMVTGTANATSGDLPMDVEFTGSVTGGKGPYTYNWSFGDGTYGSQATMSHTYTAPGTFTATLTVTDSASVTGTSSTMTITVSGQALDATASASKTSGNAPLKVTFTGTATGGKAPYIYAWDFGDGGVSVEQNPEYTFKKKGTFDVKLTVVDSLLNTKVVTVTVSVKAKKQENQPGFELMALLIAVTLVAALMRRRR